MTPEAFVAPDRETLLFREVLREVYASEVEDADVYQVTADRVKEITQHLDHFGPLLRLLQGTGDRRNLKVTPSGPNLGDGPNLQALWVEAQALGEGYLWDLLYYYSLEPRA